MLDPAGEKHITFARGDCLCGARHRLQPRAAEPVHRLARHSTGRPASSAAIRATLRLSSPA
jgi:hypothetical protein